MLEPVSALPNQSQMKLFKFYDILDKFSYVGSIAICILVFRIVFRNMIISIFTGH